jgi:hypothetical protein
VELIVNRQKLQLSSQCLLRPINLRGQKRDVLRARQSVPYAQKKNQAANDVRN